MLKNVKFNSTLGVLLPLEDIDLDVFRILGIIAFFICIFNVPEASLSIFIKRRYYGSWNDNIEEVEWYIKIKSSKIKENL